MKVTQVQSSSASATLRRDGRSKVQSRTGKSRAASNFGRRALDFGLQPSRLGDRDGIALVITLIMLAIITFMAVTFLVLSQRERSSVTTAMDQKIARDATDSAFSRSSAELLARMMLHTNYQDFDLLVSTNYYNSVGLNNTFPAPLSPTNVNYDYLNGAGQNPLNNPQEVEINIASLLYNPRPPVYVITNAGTGQEEFRFYLDLNRNGRFDRNGDWPVVVRDNAGIPRYLGTNGTLVPTNLPITSYLVTNHFVGDPEWIGMTARPWDLHSADNQFISRYAYFVVPEGKTLDVNTMHNQAVTKVLASGNDSYLRNQGVGPWELNLAAFLTDLNTNIWYGPRFLGYNPPGGLDYEYNRGLFGSANKGLSFQDAFSLLSYRYNYDYTSLMPANVLFASPAQLSVDNIDEYSDGPIMTTTTNFPEAPADLSTQNWLGSENTNHYFTPQDLFDRTKTSFGLTTAPGFSGRLQQAGTSNDTYNAYTFYRMYSQLGTDSGSDETKMNINYKNTDIHGNVVPGMETNHIPWTPLDFFTNAANRIMASVTNDMGVALSTAYIPLYPTNYYTPAVHRAMQLAANIFDATTNQTVPLLANQTNAFYPSVFHPTITASNGQVWISGYNEVVDTTPLFNYQFWDYATASNKSGTFPFVNIYGVPFVVGAKKGFPNFNQFAFQTTYALTRKLWFQRVSGTGNTSKDYRMKQEYVMDVTNQVGMQAWNSYFSQWPMASRKLRLFGTNIFTLRILSDTNPATAVDLINADTIPSGTNFNPDTWPGYNSGDPATLHVGTSSSSVKFPINATNLMMNGDLVTYDPTAPGFRPLEHFNQPTVRSNPQFYMYTTNRVVYALIDESVVPNRIVDFVNLDDSGKYVDFTGIMESQAYGNTVLQTPLQPPVIWRTNAMNGPILTDAISDGLNYQIEISMGEAPVSGWIGPKNDPNNQNATTGFENWLLNTDGTVPIGATNGAPYAPTFVVTNQASWEANDPLVHYTIPDLTDTKPDATKPAWNPGSLNHRYKPWSQTDDSTNTFAQSIAKKDPVAYVNRLGGVGTSDAWDFPTNKFWNVGILGRVHRGTPWQTVYMKSPIEVPADWLNWSGDFVITTNALTGRTNADLVATLPTTDYQLFDLFTTSPNPSASRGQLDINQTNLAAWSAVLSGVNVVTNSNGSASTYIQPAGVFDPANPTPMAKIWQGIVRTQSNTTNKNAPIFPNQTFQHLGDVLATPELSVASPYVPALGNNPNPTTANDEVYERIPQQIMSLLTLNQSPRFVIYSFGQTLHPAANHPLVTGGAFNGLCTNYQITAESATRAVVRVEGTTDPKYQGGKVDSQGRSYPPHLVVEEFNVLSPD